MRRSSRESRPPEFLTYTQHGASKLSHTGLNDDIDESSLDSNNRGNNTKSNHNRPKRKNDFEDEDIEEALNPRKKVTKPFKKSLVGNSANDTTYLPLLGQIRQQSPTSIPALAKLYAEKCQAQRTETVTQLINLVLSAAGCADDAIPTDTDLEAFNQEELEELLSSPIQKLAEIGAKVYPLSEKAKNKSSVSFRSKYQKFWESLAQTCFSMKSSSMKGKSRAKSSAEAGSEILALLIEYLAALSTLPSTNIRDAATEAAFSIVTGIVPLALQLKDAKTTAERQVRHESNEMKNPKNKAFAEQREEYSKELTEWCGLVAVAFNSIYINRSKDSNDDIRLLCVENLEQFIRLDSSKAIKTEYLKYLGWSCYDYSHAVRFEAVRSLNSLVQDDRIIEQLAAFVSHYMDRFLEMACCDVDVDVSLEMISTLRVMQRQGFLDELPSEKLEFVDIVVFDPDATPEMRKEALLFLMDHTEGFDLPAVEDFSNSLSSKPATTKKAGSKSAKSSKELKRNVAFQLETLTEVVDRHLKLEMLEWTSLLAEACLAIPEKAGILYDWNTAISLLMKDHDEDLLAKPLESVQVTALLIMVVTAAKRVNQEKRDLEGDKLQREKDLINHRWEALNETLGSKLAPLLSRFKDDERNLAALTELLSCCEINPALKSSQALLKAIQDIFLTFSNEQLLRNIVSAMKRWGVQSIFETLFHTIFQSLRIHLEGVTRSGGSNNGKNGGGKRTRLSRDSSNKSAGEDLVDERNHWHEVAGDVIRMKVFLELVDCRRYFTASEGGNMLALMVKAVSERLSRSVSEEFRVKERMFASNEGMDLATQLSSNLLFTVFSLLLWKYRDIMDLGRLVDDQQVATNDRLELEDVLDTKHIEHLKREIGELLGLREVLVDICSSFMRLLKNEREEMSQSEEEEVEDESRQERRKTIEAFAIAGFRMISMLRSYFPVRQNKYLAVDALVFQPSSEILGLLKFVFDTVSQRINHHFELNQESEESEDELEKSRLSTVLVEQLLIPLSGSFVFDTENFNRRQTAAVLLFILHRESMVQEAVKAIAKKLRDKELVAYLEAQFVALKSCFSEEIYSNLAMRAQAENSEEDVDFDLHENEQAIALGYERLVGYARKFSSLLGVGKLKDAALQAVEAFLKLAIDFSLADSFHVGFCEGIAPFLRFLSFQRKRDLLSYLLEELEGNEKYAELRREVERQRSAPNTEFKRFFTFLDQLSGSASASNQPKGKRKLSSSSSSRLLEKAIDHEGRMDEDEDEEEEEEAVGDFLTPTKKGAKENKPKSKRAISAVNGRKQSAGTATPKKALSPIKETRRSQRAAAKKTVNYEEPIEEFEEDEGDDVEETEEVEGTAPSSAKSQEIQRGVSKSIQKRLQTPPSVSTFATGLDIQDFVEDSDHRNSSSLLSSERRNSSRHSSTATAALALQEAQVTRTRKRSRDAEVPPALLSLETSPIQLTGIEELEDIPRRRRLLG